MTASPIIVWFRQDLRLSDNPALYHAVNTNTPILPIYILDDKNAGAWQMGGASRAWLHHSLNSLNQALGGQLRCFKGNPQEIIQTLIAQTNTKHISWNRCYEPWRIKRDSEIKTALIGDGIKVDTYNGSLLWEPWQVLKKDKTPYKVFTPYYRKGCMGLGTPEQPLAAPDIINFYNASEPGDALAIDQLQLLPNINWHQDLMDNWQIGESAAQEKCATFIEGGLNGYKSARDFPAKPHVSRLSPHLHFGEISPRQIWHMAQIHKMLGCNNEKDLDHFLTELGWREFSYYLLYHFPSLPKKNFQPKFDNFPWRDNPEHLKAWQIGQTGYPIIDAAMRELYQTGFMHNRCRMIVGSFLVKNLLTHWHQGEKWFWDCLVDADLAANSASWQWIAGSGADAAPYFRIFNPVTQSRKFDAEGEYIKTYLPELQNVPPHLLHEPWNMSAAEQEKYGVTIGQDYPKPIIDLKQSRTRALTAYNHIKQIS